MTTHAPLHDMPMPRYASSSDMSSTSSTFDLGSEQQEGKYMKLKIVDEQTDNANVMSIWSEGEENDCNAAEEYGSTPSSSSSQEYREVDSGAVGAPKRSTNDDFVIRGWKVAGRMDSLGGKVFLKDENGRLLAVVIRDYSGYAILGLTPVYENQNPHTRLEKRSLYKWASVKRRSTFWRESYSITREDDGTSYITKECGSRFGARRLKISKDGRTCGLIEQSFANGILTNSEWNVQVGVDIGPRAVVCFLAIINKSMGRLL